jgi:hypothetical protein
VAYSLIARTVESQQPAVTRQRPVNNNKETVFSAQYVPIASHATMEYVMPSLNNNCTATEEQYFLRGPCRDVISRIIWLLQLENYCGSVVVSCCS